MANEHIIHLANGQLSPKSSTSREDVRRLVVEALSQQPPAGLAVHFHGGLVSEKAGRAIAQRLTPVYQDAGAYPLFFVWESGLLEAVGNNLRDISQENLFREFVKKVAEWALKKLPAGVGFKGAAGAAVNEIQLRQDFDAWFRGERATPPEALENRPGTDDAAIQATLKGTLLDQASLEAEIQMSIEGDFTFQDAVQEVFNGLRDGGVPQPTTKGVGGSTVATTSLISPDAADQLFERSPVTTKGFSLIGWFKSARMVAGIVVAVVRRMAAGRGHGLYVTTVEEVLRALYLDKLGTFIWNQMKKDTADAFLPGENHGGTALLAELRKHLDRGASLPRITLIGHSTGAIYICQFIEAAAQMLPGSRFEVVFLAPALTYERFAATLANHGPRIANFRSFAMNDDWEIADNLVPIIYPRSLLYFVSGLLEPSVDEPLVGMERYLRENQIFTPAEFPAIARARAFYGDFPESLVWSPDTQGEGSQSLSAKHGDFDNDHSTLRSLQWLLKQGF
ncbi:hypothetical protein [Geoalkalibacter sp.]|uniref:hypothetical protein n=1 Tax=Geoalkalibacter sp. TaxID=3041440 RepID=UPI00272E3ED1|nr:hypothetical protein [Geoalkalibacter sp.]